jgi:hypothetical protein
MTMLAAALLFGAAEFWHTIVPRYGADDITMGRLWFMVSARSMAFVETLITQHVWSPLWDLGISPILVAPAWSFFGVLGFLFFVFGRPKVSDR